MESNETRGPSEKLLFNLSREFNPKAKLVDYKNSLCVYYFGHTILTQFCNENKLFHVFIKACKANVFETCTFPLPL